MRKIRSTIGVAAFLLLAVTGCGSATPAAGNGANSTQGGSPAATNQTANTATSQTTGGSLTSTASSGRAARWNGPPAMQLQAGKQYIAVVHTNYGTFTAKLFATRSPITVNNFVFLANHKFYNGDTFFRIIKSFMVQTGDPNNNGTGGPGYTIPDELPPEVPYTAGVIAMANTGQPNSGGSQFFICTVNDSQALVPSYTELGQVISGMSVIKAIAAIPVVANPAMGGELSKPTKIAEIESISIQTR